MKNRFSLALLTLLCIACSEDNDLITTNQSVAVNNAASDAGTWRITYFSERDTDKTTKFAGHAFTFGAANVLTSTKGNTIQTGTWKVSDSNSNDDSLYDLHFNIAFVAPAESDALSDNWEIVEYASTKIKLMDVSGDNGNANYLTFEKN